MARPGAVKFFGVECVAVGDPHRRRMVAIVIAPRRDSHVLELPAEEDSRSGYAGKLEVRAPGAPTTWPARGRREVSVGHAIVMDYQQESWLGWIFMTHGAVRLWLRLEGLAALIVSLCFYARYPGGWLLFTLLFLTPDLSLFVYPAGPRTGAIVYNIMHSYTLPIGVLLLGIGRGSVFVQLALIWMAHISFDRLIGFGLQYPTGTGETHLGRIRRARVSSEA